MASYINITQPRAHTHTHIRVCGHYICRSIAALLVVAEHNAIKINATKLIANYSCALRTLANVIMVGTSCLPAILPAFVPLPALLVTSLILHLWRGFQLKNALVACL